MIYSLSTIPLIDIYERSIPCRNLLNRLFRLARNLISEICAKIFESIKKIIFSPGFVTRFRKHPTDFTRQRKLPFHILIAFLINFVHGSYQDELDKFFKTILRLDVAKRFVSKAALSKARMKLKYEAFIELNIHLIQLFEKHFSPRKWFGFRLLAIDSSTTRLPMTEEIIQHFGVWHSRQGQPSPVARLSQIFDVLNKITIDAIISPKAVAERDLAAQQLRSVTPQDLLLLDRGYPAWWFFKLILSENTNFCARLPCEKWKVARKFLKSQMSEKLIELPIPKTSMKQCKQLQLDTSPMKLRLVRIENDGKVSVLITSLIDCQKYPVDVFKGLYHSRWPVEEDYKTIKCRMELENFSGKSALSVYQDFHAKVFAKNLVWLMAFSVQDRLNETDSAKKYEYQINFTQAFSKSKGAIALLFHDKIGQLRTLIADLQHIFQRTIEPIRPGRKYPRNHKAVFRKYYLEYKPIG